MTEQKVLEGFRAAALRVGITGAVRTAKIGADVPKMKTKYDTDVHRNIGYISADGVEVSFDEDANEYIPWQEVAAIRRDITKSVTSVKFTLWDFGKDNAAFFFGSEVTLDEEDGSWSIGVGGKPKFDRQQFVVDVVDGDQAMKLVLPVAQLTERGSIVFKSDEAIALECTVTAYPAGADEYANDTDVAGKSAIWRFTNNWDGTGATGDEGTFGSTLAVSTSTLAGATKSTAYNATLAASGGSTPYTWRVSTGTLPAGLTLSTAGAITGTPTTTGTSTFTVEVMDSKSAVATKQLSITVAA